MSLLVTRFFIPYSLGFAICAASVCAQTQSVTYNFALSPAHVVPPAVSSAIGSTSVVIDPATNVVSIAGSYLNLSGQATVGHVHTGSAGTNGGVLFGLTLAGGSSGHFYGTAALDSAQFQALLSGDIYVNVATTQFPDGEIRGQVVDGFRAFGFEHTTMGAAVAQVDGNTKKLKISNLGSSGRDGVSILPPAGPPSVSGIEFAFQPVLTASSPSGSFFETKIHGTDSNGGSVTVSQRSDQLNNEIVVTTDFSQMGAVSKEMRLSLAGVPVTTLAYASSADFTFPLPSISSGEIKFKFPSGPDVAWTCCLPAVIVTATSGGSFMVDRIDICPVGGGPLAFNSVELLASAPELNITSETFFAGSGSPTSVGTPYLEALGAPHIGNGGFGMVARNLIPNGFSGFLVGFDTQPGTQIPGGPVGATLYVDPTVLVSALGLSSPQGTAQLMLPVPNNPNLIGLSLVTQVIDFDLTLPGAVPIGLSSAMFVRLD